MSGASKETEESIPQPQPAKKTASDFIFGKLLGEGSYSSVYLAKDIKTNKLCAIKVCNKYHIIKERKAESIPREKEVMRILSSNQNKDTPFFVHLYATFQDRARLYFVLSFEHGGELLKYLQKAKRFSYETSRFYTGEIVQALKHLHNLGIVHRDLKPENILLTENGHIRITDFGSAKLLSRDTKEAEKENEKKCEDGTRRTRSSSFVGTAQYVSPEVLKGKYSEVGPPADLWALGCILYYFMSGSTPFQDANEFLIFQRILKLNYSFPDGFDEKAKSLVEQLLVINSSDRLGAGDAVRYTSIEQHPFLSDIATDELHSITPPQVKKFQSKLSNHSIPDDFEPGFNPRVIAERALREDGSFPWAGSNQLVISDDDSSSDDGLELSANDDNGRGSKIPAQKESNTITDGMKDLNLNQQEALQQKKIIPEKKSKSFGSPKKTGVFLFPSNDQERQSRLMEQEKNTVLNKIAEGNLILKQGIISKRKGLFARKRLFLLTEGPRLIYCHPTSFQVKGEIPWSSDLKAEPKDFKNFLVHTPHRTYYLEDATGCGLEWCKAINHVCQVTYGKSQESGAKVPMMIAPNVILVDNSYDSGEIRRRIACS